MVKCHPRRVTSFLIALALGYILLKVAYFSNKLKSQVPTRPTLYDAEIEIVVLGSENGGKREQRSSTKSKTVADEACAIPRLDINGTEVRDFFRPVEPVQCSEDPNWVRVDDEGRVRYAEGRKKAYCSAALLERVNDYTVVEGRKVAVKEGDRLPGDHVVFRCSQGRFSWMGLGQTVVAKPKVLERIAEKRKKSGACKEKLNVLIMSFDSLSQMSFRRKLPKSVKVLEEELGAVVMNGYNIVGDGTPQAFIPILTGATEEELPLTR